ncbi:MAG: DNA topoisomerase I, partial [Treponema sp.]|nr:DNA topoisomerase I [Treponema sp.]
MAAETSELKAVKPKTKKKSTSRKTPAKQPAKKTLVIMESPHKAETVQKILGSAYTVKACIGHLIDLPKSRTAIDVDHNFEPEYITVRGRSKLLKELQGDAKKANLVLLASDPDR